MAQASRGWARHIERHFPLQAVKIVWKSNLPAYLVEAVTDDGNRGIGSIGYYLFDDKLTQGVLVAKSWDKTMENLRASPLVFDGECMMEADADEAQRHTETNNIQHWAGWKPAIPIAASRPAPMARSLEVAGDGMDLD